jgi:hypothetical protein
MISLEFCRTHRDKNVHGLPPKNPRREGAEAINQGQKEGVHG